MVTPTIMSMDITMPDTQVKALNWSKLIKEGFGVSFWVFLLLAMLAGVACYFIKGADVFAMALTSELEMLKDTLPRMIAALGSAGIVWVLLPKDKIGKYVGQDSGIKGLIIATLASIITPGGPSAAFSLLAVLGGAGADRGILVAYITGWSMLGLQRMLVWDLPFMGVDFALSRFLICLPLPIIAGMIARRVPIKLTLNNTETS